MKLVSTRICLSIYEYSIQNQTPYSSILFGLINVSGLFFQCCRNVFQFLRHIMDPGIKLLLDNPDLLNVSFLGLDLEQ